MTTERDMLRRDEFRPYCGSEMQWFSVEMWDTHRLDSMGKSVLGYELRTHLGDDSSVTFTGDDFHCSPMHAIDSDDAVRALMSFLTLRPGDTDAEYFDGYTQEQMDFCRCHAEALDSEVRSVLGDDE